MKNSYCLSNGLDTDTIRISFTYLIELEKNYWIKTPIKISELMLRVKLALHQVNHTINHESILSANALKVYNILTECKLYTYLKIRMLSAALLTNPYRI